jgi:hypothetical protein
MNTKLVLAILGVALVAAALVGVSAAAFAGPQYTTNPTQTQWVPPCANSAGVVPPYCINSTTGEPYCYTNGTYTGYCWNGTGLAGGYCGNGGCGYGYGYGTQAQLQNQNQYGWGMMGRAFGSGFGCRR